MNQYLEHIVKKIPHQPGVYKMKNEEGDVIYVGKAKDLRKRVASYFNKKHEYIKVARMVEKIHDLEYMLASSELEALMLETNLIKELRPKYNILMKDDKNYAYIKITLNEDYPRIMVVRKVEKDKAKYFGPKTNATKIIKTLKVIRKVFPYRHCQLEIEDVGPADNPLDKRKVKVTKANIKYPCLYYHIHRCAAPCIGKTTKEEFREIINQVIRFLEGKHEEIKEKLKTEMLEAASAKKFELAGRIRDKLKDIDEITEKQLVIDPGLKDIDVLNYHQENDKFYFNLFQVRNGKLIDQENFVLKQNIEKKLEADEEENRLSNEKIPGDENTQNDKNSLHEENSTDKGKSSDKKQQKTDSPSHLESTSREEILSSFLQQYYSKAVNIPSEILIPDQLEDGEILGKWLTEMKGQKVILTTPQKGKKDELMKLAHKNAQSYAEQSTSKWEGQIKETRIEALTNLQKLFKLKKLPKRLECYDISHFGGTETVASMTVFENGFPKNKDYRQFKIHLENSGEPNDFLSIEEALTRRLKYLKPSLAAKDIKLKLLKEEKKVSDTPQGEHTKKDLEDFTYEIHEFELKIGQIALQTRKNKKLLIKELTCPNHKIETVIKKIAEKHKVKRLYLFKPQNQVNDLLEIGFQEVKKLPDFLSLDSENTLLVFDKYKDKIDESFKKVPDLIVIDGGKGQLSSGVKILKKYNLDLPMISIAKREEEFFVPGEKKSIRLEPNNPVRLLLQHLRDEAHRFAINYQKNLRLKMSISSKLDEIYGIGEQLKKRLLQKYGSVDGIKNAPQEELEKIIGTKLASKIKKEL